MATFSFPNIEPSSTEWSLVANTEAYRSPLTGAIQTVDRTGEFWRVVLSFSNLTDGERAAMQAFLVKLQGQRHRFRLTDHSFTNRGVLDGTPVIDGANQLGETVRIDGASVLTTNWARAGDRIQIGNELYMVLNDESSGSVGQVFLDLAPRVSVAHPDNEPVVVSGPNGIFLLEDPTVSWSNVPGGFSSFGFTAIQDIT